MTDFKDVSGIRVKALHIDGASISMGGSTAVAAAGLTAWTMSFTNYSVSDIGNAFDSTESGAAAVAAQVTELYAQLHSLGVISSITYDGT